MSSTAAQRPDSRHHSAPRAGDVFRAQLALVAAPPRRGLMVGLTVILVQLISLASWGYVAGVAIQIGDNPSTRITKISDLGLDEGVGAVLFAFGAALVWAAFWPERSRRGAGETGRAYHWAMPVDRRLHDLLRVAAGAAWLLPLSALLLLTTVVVASVFGHGSHLQRFPAAAWLAFFISPLLTYLLTSIPSLMRGRRQMYWLWLALGTWIALFGLMAVAGGRVLLDELFLGPFGLARALAGPFFTLAGPDAQRVQDPWLPAFLVWLTVALLGVLAAASDRGRRDS